MIKNEIIGKFAIEYDIENHQKIHATIKIEPSFKDIKEILNKLKDMRK